MRVFKNTPERIVDEYSGIEILRLAPDALASMPPTYDWPSVTPDNRFAIARCEFAPESGKPSGFYRFAVDEGEMAFLTETGIHPRMTPDGRYLYGLRQHDPILRRVDIATGETVEVSDLTPALAEGWEYAQTRLSPVSNHVYVGLRTPDIRPIRVDLNTGEAIRMDHVDGMLYACVGEEARMVVARLKPAEKGRLYGYLEYRKLEQNPGDRSLWSLDPDGGDDRFLCTDLYSHGTMLGRTSWTQGCGKWGNRSVTIAGNGDERRVVCEGPYFWHSGASYDGEWIAADSNWPDYGIFLVHVPTGNFRYVCHPRSSLKTGLDHAHPTLGHDGRVMMFRSDRSGTGQAYMVRIPEEFRASVKAGDRGGDAPVVFKH